MFLCIRDLHALYLISAMINVFMNKDFYQIVYVFIRGVHGYTDEGGELKNN